MRIFLRANESKSEKWNTVKWNTTNNESNKLIYINQFSAKQKSRRVSMSENKWKNCESDKRRNSKKLKL
jgi:hypothetical protein